MDMLSWLMEWGGSLTGLLGAYLVSSNDHTSRWGQVAFLVSNFLWIGYGVSNEMWSMLVMQVGFTFTSLRGINRWFFTKTPEAQSV